MSENDETNRQFLYPAPLFVLLLIRLVAWPHSFTERFQSILLRLENRGVPPSFGSERESDTITRSPIQGGTGNSGRDPSRGARVGSWGLKKNFQEVMFCAFWCTLRQDWVILSKLNDCWHFDTDSGANPASYLSLLVNLQPKLGEMVMSPYEFTSKTHSLSTEDLVKIFIHSLIYLSTPWEHFTINRKWARKSWIISRKSEENEQKISLIFVVAIVLKGLCSGFRVHI